MQQEVFISYAWGGESEILVNQIDAALQKRGIVLVRDKRDLGFKGLIKEFMQRIGQGGAVVVILSDKYLKSENCMFELLEIAKHGNLYSRIFPIVLPDALFYKPVQRVGYLKYWEDRITELNEALKGLQSFADTQGLREDMDLFTDIRGAIASLTDTLRNMNALTVDLHQQSGFEELYQALDQQLQQLTPQTTAPPSKPSGGKRRTGKILYQLPPTMPVHNWTRCIVRLAFEELSEAILKEGLGTGRNIQIESVRVGRVMEVHLMEATQSPDFEIVALSQAEQLIEEEDFTEWRFNVRPHRMGTFTLVIRVTLVEIVEGYGERKKDIVLEKEVQIVAEQPEWAAAPAQAFEQYAQPIAFAAPMPAPQAPPKPTPQRRREAESTDFYSEEAKEAPTPANGSRQYPELTDEYPEQEDLPMPEPEEEISFESGEDAEEAIPAKKRAPTPTSQTTAPPQAPLPTIEIQKRIAYNRAPQAKQGTPLWVWPALVVGLLALLWIAWKWFL